MKINLASRMEEYREGIFQVLDQKKNELLSQGRTVYNLSVGTPDFAPSPHIIDAVREAAKKPENYKYSLGMLPELRQAVISRYRTRYGVKLDEKEVTIVYGSQEGIAHIGFALCDPGDIVLVPNPGYPIFGLGPALAGANIVTYDLREEEGYIPQLSKLPDDVLRKAKCIIVSYPLNPICKAAPEGFYEELLEWAEAHDILIIHDNAYSDIIFDGRVGRSILSLPGAKERCVEFYSLSKSYCYTGARAAFLVGNEQVVTAIGNLRSQIDYGTFLPVQYGAIAALTGPDRDVLDRCGQYQERRDALCGGLRKIGWDIPDSEGTMFAWGRIPRKYGEDDVSFVMALMEKTGVLCTPGSSFGSLGAGHVRFALTLPAQGIRKAVAAISDSHILD